MTTMQPQDLASVIAHLRRMASSNPADSQGAAVLGRVNEFLTEHLNSMVNSPTPRDDGGWASRMKMRDEFASSAMNALICASVQRNGGRVFLAENSGPDMAACAWAIADDMIRARAA